MLRVPPEDSLKSLDEFFCVFFLGKWWFSNSKEVSSDIIHIQAKGHLSVYLISVSSRFRSRCFFFPLGPNCMLLTRVKKKMPHSFFQQLRLRTFDWGLSGVLDCLAFSPLRRK